MAELAGINLSDFLEEGKGTGGGNQTQGGKGKSKVGFHETDSCLRTTSEVYVCERRRETDQADRQLGGGGHAYERSTLLFAVLRRNETLKPCVLR